MKRGAVVQTASVPADLTATGVSQRTILDCATDAPGLVRRLVEVSPLARLDGTTAGAGELWFVIAGSGQIDIDGQPGLRVGQDRGLLIPPGSRYQVSASDHDGLRLDVVILPAGPPVTASTAAASTAAASTAAASTAAASTAAGGPAAAAQEPLTCDLAGCDVERTGDREFRVLFGPGRGCSVATQFVGEIPPGRAPEHSHPYDEVVLILAGEGVAHIGGADHALSAGTCIHLPPGLPHCLENTGSAIMRVLGVFHPADSPAAKLESARR